MLEYVCIRYLTRPSIELPLACNRAPVGIEHRDLNTFTYDVLMTSSNEAFHESTALWMKKFLWRFNGTRGFNILLMFSRWRHGRHECEKKDASDFFTTPLYCFFIIIIGSCHHFENFVLFPSKNFYGLVQSQDCIVTPKSLSWFS